jgi:hypothetical protein
VITCRGFLKPVDNMSEPVEMEIPAKANQEPRNGYLSCVKCGNKNTIPGIQTMSLADVLIMSHSINAKSSTSGWISTIYNTVSNKDEGMSVKEFWLSHNTLINHPIK